MGYMNYRLDADKRSVGGTDTNNNNNVPPQSDNARLSHDVHVTSDNNYTSTNEEAELVLRDSLEEETVQSYISNYKGTLTEIIQI